MSIIVQKIHELNGTVNHKKVELWEKWNEYRLKAKLEEIGIGNKTSTHFSYMVKSSFNSFDANRCWDINLLDNNFHQQDCEFILMCL